jgi:enoyl-CoA hydratase/carnithine racemase
MGDCMDVGGPWETLEVDVDGPVAVLTLNRPERMNAMSPTMSKELGLVWDAFEADVSLRVAVITGAGDRAFCSGADVSTVADTSRPRTGVLERELHFTPMQAKVSKPTICAVNGVCAGGGLHFVMECDFSIAAARATFLDPHVSIGQVSSTETLVLSRRIPHQAALRMVLMGSAERVNAARALELGIVTEVVENEQLMSRAKELAHAIAKNSPTAIAISRYVLWQGLEQPMTDALRQGFALLRAHADSHPDAQEGPAAFLAKREPSWADAEPGGPLAFRQR